MKFNVGEWVMKPGVTSYNCEQIRQVRVAQDGKSVYLYAVSYRADVRGLDGPSLELTISSPRRDVLRVQACHFRGSRAKMPSFELNDDALTPAVLKIVTRPETALPIFTNVATTLFHFAASRKPLTIRSTFPRLSNPSISHVSASTSPLIQLVSMVFAINSVHVFFS